MILCLGTTPAVQRTLRFTHFKLDAVNRAADVFDYAGGKASNVARVAHQLGESVLTCGFLGGDTGTFIRKNLDQTGILHDFVTVKPPTRLCVTIVDQFAGTSTELVEEAAALEETDWNQLDQTLLRHLKTATVLVLTGSLPPKAPVDFYARCTAAARQLNLPVVLDARGEPLQRALPHHPTVVKPNLSELAATVGREIQSDADLRQAITRLIEQGAQWAIITRGPQPAIVSDGRSFWTITAPAVPILNTIGSGDAFTAGLAVAISRGTTLPDACHLAAACGTSNAMTLRAGYIEPPKVLEFQSQIRIAHW